MRSPCAQIKRDRCVLDGELVIWHAAMQQFVEFGARYSDVLRAAALFILSYASLSGDAQARTRR